MRDKCTHFFILPPGGNLGKCKLCGMERKFIGDVDWDKMFSKMPNPNINSILTETESCGIIV